MPVGYGSVTPGAARALWRSSAGVVQPIVAMFQSSMLCHAFNTLWAAALNMSRDGEAPAFFAMLHSDVEPDDFWLDILIRELEANDLDVLGAVVPIKDRRGVTSLAVDLPESGNGSGESMKRLSLHEAFDLPTTFTSDDVGGRLLINTGCWVCRFDEAWARRVCFTMNDAIKFSAESGFSAAVEPEDWHASRQFHRLGLRIGATRAVRLDHVGVARFSNAEPWGTVRSETAERLRPSIPAV